MYRGIQEIVSRKDWYQSWGFKRVTTACPEDSCCDESVTHVDYKKSPKELTRLAWPELETESSETFLRSISRIRAVQMRSCNHNLCLSLSTDTRDADGFQS